MERVIVYIDGFNLYYGLRDKGWHKYNWLNIRRLSQEILLPHQTLERVRYFTARVFYDPRNPGKVGRQRAFLDAAGTLPDVHVHYGAYKRKSLKCPECRHVWRTHEEKMTDVNIAVELLGDAVDNAFDTAIVVSADSDLVGPVKAVLGRYPSKRIVVAFPPKRFSIDLKQVASGSLVIGRKNLKVSQFPNRVATANGAILTRPPAWN